MMVKPCTPPTVTLRAGRLAAGVLLLLAPLMVSAGHGHRGWSGSYGHGYNAPVYGGYPYSYGPVYYTPYYGPLVYHYQRLPHRPFPFETPRIYVVPSQPSATSPPANISGRRIIVYSFGDDGGDGQDFRHEPQPVQRLTGEPFAATPPITAENAWEALATGKDAQALEAFAALAREKADHAAYKTGYGLAAAFGGDKITAAYGLGRAFATDPAGAANLPASSLLQLRLKELSESYQDALSRAPEDAHLLFLNAAVSLLAGQPDIAGRHLEKLQEIRPSTSTTTSLARALQHATKTP